MGGCGNILFIPIITFSAALITYNIITSPILKQEISKSNGDFVVVDPIIQMPKIEKENNKRRLFHTAVTASEGAYNLWQCRIMYYWFKKFKDGPGSDMGGFTRILHSGVPDEFMDEIPTFVAQPLEDGLDQVFFLLPQIVCVCVWVFIYLDYYYFIKPFVFIFFILGY